VLLFYSSLSVTTYSCSLLALTVTNISVHLRSYENFLTFCKCKYIICIIRTLT